MTTRLAGRRPKRRRGRNRKLLRRLIENRLIDRVDSERYRNKVREVYDGRQGALLATASKLSLHEPLGRRLFQRERFSLRGAQRILDVGSGAGQISKHLIDFADPNAEIVCTDLSHGMLRRARNRLDGRAPQFASCDLTHLPFADESFDRVTCGYVLEHLQDPEPGLKEVARVLRAGGRMLLLTSEDSIGGAWTSRFWYCRTYNREELLAGCERVGLRLRQELWFSRIHEILRAGGICVELEKVPAP